MKVLVLSPLESRAKHPKAEYILPASGEFSLKYFTVLYYVYDIHMFHLDWCMTVAWLDSPMDLQVHVHCELKNQGFMVLSISS